jgi:hypothetical protein
MKNARGFATIGERHCLRRRREAMTDRPEEPDATAAGGAGPEHVIKWNLLVVEGVSLQEGFSAFQRAWVATPNPPAITMAYVAGLANPEFLVEMDAIAVVPL